MIRLPWMNQSIRTMRLVNAHHLYLDELPLIESAFFAKVQVQQALLGHNSIYGLDTCLAQIARDYYCPDLKARLLEELDNYRYLLLGSHCSPPVRPFLDLSASSIESLQQLTPEDFSCHKQQHFIRFYRFSLRSGAGLAPPAETSQTQAINEKTQPLGKTGALANTPTHHAASLSGSQPGIMQAPGELENRHWLALRYQTPNAMPLAGEAYKITLADGSELTGTLDNQGEARLENLPAGKAKVELGNTSPELDTLRSEMKRTLSAIIAEREAETARIDKELDDMGEQAATGELIAVGVKSLWSGFTDTLSFIGNALVKTAEATYYLTPAKRITNLLQAGWQSYRAGELSEDDWYRYLANHYQRQDYEDLVELLGFEPKDIDPKAFAQAYEITSLILSDDECRDILSEFGSEYIASTSSTGWAEVAGGAVFEIVLTALLLVFTAGAGNLALVASKVKHSDKLKALGEQLLKLGQALKRKQSTKQLDTQTNKQVIATRSLPQGVVLEARPKIKKVDNNKDKKPDQCPRCKAKWTRTAPTLAQVRQAVKQTFISHTDDVKGLGPETLLGYSGSVAIGKVSNPKKLHFGLEPDIRGECGTHYDIDGFLVSELASKIKKKKGKRWANLVKETRNIEKSIRKSLKQQTDLAYLEKGDKGFSVVVYLPQEANKPISKGGKIIVS